MSESPPFETKGDYAIKERSSAEPKKPDAYTKNPFTEMLQQDARGLLAHAVADEVTSFLPTHADIRNEKGRKMIVLNGYLPTRAIQTGIGTIPERGMSLGERLGMGERSHEKV